MIGYFIPIDDKLNIIAQNFSIYFKTQTTAKTKHWHKEQLLCEPNWTNLVLDWILP